jgi:hypothetical protein
MTSGVQPSLFDVASLFKDYSGDEAGGVHAIRGFSFQVWQAVLEALGAHATGDDYAVVMEWQQDIALLDSSTSPSKVTFKQLKKNESSAHWTLPALLNPPEEKTAAQATAGTTAPKPKKTSTRSAGKVSVLAKLYFHRRRFGQVAPTRIVFASNAPLYVEADDGSKHTLSKTEFSALPAATQAKISTALRTQLEIPASEAIDLDCIAFEVTNCPLEQAHKYAIGELVEHCQLGKIQPLVTAPFVAVCLIASYIQQRAGSASFAKDFSALLERAVTRADITSYLAAANDSHVSTQDLVEQVISRLDRELADFEVVQGMQDELNAACAEITNRASAVWISVDTLCALYRERDGYRAKGPLKDRFPAWREDFRARASAADAPFSDGFLYCLMAMIVKNARPIQHLSTTSVGTQPKVEE